MTSPAAAARRKNKGQTKFAEELVTPTPEGQSEKPFAKDADTGRMSPTPDKESRQSRVSFIDVAARAEDEPVDPLDVWVKSTLKKIVDDVSEREDPFQIIPWVKNVLDDTSAKVVKKEALASTGTFAKSVIGECIALACLGDWSKECLRRIMDRQSTTQRESRRSSLSMAAPMFLDESIQKEFGTTRIVSLEPGLADHSAELGQ
jgi:hypothetical protein